MKRYTLGAGLFFITLAIVVQGLLPIAIPASRETRAPRAVRNETGDIRWVWYESDPYTAREALGRRVYQREGCWYCHSQYVRPVAGEEERWGPLSLVGEYAHDRPHLLATRRIGPDLSRVGLKVSDHWHYAHHWAPAMLVPDTVMPSFRWLFRMATVRVGEVEGQPAFADQSQLWTLFSFRTDRRILLQPSPEGVAFAEDDDGVPVLDIAQLPAPYDAVETWKGKTLTVVVPSEEMRGLVGYLQKIGTNRGAWRDVYEPQTLSASVMSIPQTDEQVERGKAVYERRCAGCHGIKGDGNGPAATFLSPRPRNFALGSFKFRSTPSGSLPTDGDLYRTLARGVRWTAMPTWHELPEKDRFAAIAYIKTFSSRWKSEKPEAPIPIGEPPAASPELLLRGRALYTEAKCAQCHGPQGRGDGPSAADLKDDLGFPIRPADFTKGQFKGGSDVRDIYRTMTAGLDGTPMPSYIDSMNDDERWAISYYVLSFSAFSNPLTGEKLRLDAAARNALNAPAREMFTSPRTALDPDRPPSAALDPKAPVRFFRGLLGEGR